MLWIKRTGIVLATLSIFAASAQERLVLGGAGSMIPIAQELATAFQSMHPGAQIDVIANSMGSNGGMQALDAGKVHVALVARLLTAEERAKRNYRAVGRVPVVFAVHKDVAVNAVAEKQACDIFAGRIKSWSDLGGGAQKVVALTRNEDDGTKEAVRKKVGCFKDLRESPDTVVITKSAAMISGLSNQPGTVGMTELNSVFKSQGAMKALALDGVTASAESVASGKYKLAKDYGFVTQGEPQGLARRFIDFAEGPAARKLLLEAGIVPVR